MSYTDLRTRFAEKYKGDVKDPILNMLLDTIDAYQNDVQEKMLLSIYSSWSQDIPDGLFEVLRRHLFGQMFPGPAYSVAQASLREANDAIPIKLETYHHLSLQDDEGNKNLFTPQKSVWIAPAFSNDVSVESEGDNLILGFQIVRKNLEMEEGDGLVSLFAENIPTIIMERLRCRIAQFSRFFESSVEKKSYFRSSYPSAQNINSDFFEIPYSSLFINIPFSVFLEHGFIKGDDNKIYLQFGGLADYEKKLYKKLTINAFPVWNVVEKEVTIQNTFSSFRYALPELHSETKETLITSVKDIGKEPPVEYINSATVMDPGYPFQFTSAVDKATDSLMLAVTPQPEGELKVRYYQYDLSDLSIDIPAGKPFTLYMGMDEHLHSVFTIVNTSRNEAINDKERIWTYFRSMLASRNRLLTKSDMNAAIKSYPPFGGNYEIIDFENVVFQEKVGRVKGFLTPYTEISIPVLIDGLLKAPDKPYFEREIGLYLKNKTVNGNFIKVKLIPKEK